MGILLAFIAGLFLPLTNLTVRKSVDVSGHTKAYFVFQMAASFLVALALGPIRHADFSIPIPVAFLGILAGIILSGLIFSLGKAIETGPPALTFSILNAATLTPGLVMALFFGASLGFVYNIWHALGSLCVLAGLIWAGKRMEQMEAIKKWFAFTVLMFFFHAILLVVFQYRGMLIHFRPETFFSLENIESEWFTPFFFFTAGAIQLILYLRFRSREERKLQKGEVIYGFLGGITNSSGNFFLIWAAETASGLENAVIFPIYAVVGIVITNFWGQKLYKEKVNWAACQLCVFGLFVGSVDWKMVMAAIGF